MNSKLKDKKKVNSLSSEYIECINIDFYLIEEIKLGRSSSA